MNTIQVLIILTNGLRKYGTIINGSEAEREIKFVPVAEILEIEESLLANLIEHIPVANIYSIDTFLK